MNKKINRNELTGTKLALKNEWMRKQLSIEITTAEGSRYIDNVNKRKIKEYSLSSQNRRSIQASDITVETYRDYCDWLWSIINKSEMRHLSASINEIEKLEKSLP